MSRPNTDGSGLRHVEVAPNRRGETVTYQRAAEVLEVWIGCATRAHGTTVRRHNPKSVGPAS